MLRILLVAAFATLAISHSAEASVLTDVSDDTLTIDGDAADDQITLRLAPGAPNILQVGQASFDRATFSRIAIRAGAGADAVRIDDSNGAFTDTETTTIETGAGSDSVIGGSGAETIATGDDIDFVNSGGGADHVALGPGDDTFIQNPGAGFDVLEAQSGNDTLRINGSSQAEEFTVQTHLGRLLVNRDSGDVGMSAGAVETLEVNAGRSADLVDVGNLAGSELKRLDADLGVDDDARDTIAANLTDDEDVVEVYPIDERVVVDGGPYELRVENAVRADDRMTLFAGAGNDVVFEADDAAAQIELTLDGGPGRDEIGGSAEILRGGDGDDVVSGGRLARVIDLGAGNDRFKWIATTTGKTIEGGPGVDQVIANGAASDDLFHVEPAGPRVRVTRGLTESLDVGGTEIVVVEASAGADRIVTSDLAGTAVTLLEVRPGQNDLKPDTVFVNGTSGADNLRVSKLGLLHTISGQGETLTINAAEPGDRLQLNGGSGDDTLDAGQMGTDQFEPFIDGGPGKDTIIGSPGEDGITGGPDADVVSMRDGADTFTWSSGHGNDFVEGGVGTDSLRMDGTSAPEQFEVAPSGVFTRVITGNTVVDLGGLERLNILPGGGIDTLRVRDLTGTATKLVDWDLAPFRGTTTSDGNLDSLTVDGTFGNDSINVTASGPSTRVTGLAAAVRAIRPDQFDRLHVDTKPGPDVVSVDPAVHNLLTFTSL